MKDKFLVRGLSGKKKLKGSIAVGGAKNAALKLLATTILFKGPVVLNNLPDIEDVRRMTEILSDLGASVERLGKHSYRINTDTLNKNEVDQNMGRRMRASIVLTGPLLARFGEVTLPHPGGDVIGSRPIDLFLSGFKSMGASVEWRGERYRIHTPKKKKLRGASIFSALQTVTVTETLLMAGVLAEGKSVLKNAAMEPEIKELADFLSAGGAKISGAGTPTISVEGGGLLKAEKAWSVMPDRIEAGSFLILGALAAENLEITDCLPEHLESVLNLLRLSGVPMKIKKNSIFISGNDSRVGSFQAINVKTHEYPGFPTDLQAPMVVFLTQAKGESLVFETIFEGRLAYTADLVSMGADIKMWDPHRVMVKGPTPLRGRELEGPDIRAGLAFLIAALVAKGESVLNSVYHIDRGYESIEKRLALLGAKVERVR